MSWTKGKSKRRHDCFIHKSETGVNLSCSPSDIKGLIHRLYSLVKGRRAFEWRCTRTPPTSPVLPRVRGVDGRRNASGYGDRGFSRGDRSS